MRAEPVRAPRELPWPPPPARLLDRYREIRSLTESLAERLSPEDCVVQSMPDVSPAKWHLAHVSWFFETFVLADHAPGHRPDESFAYLFNSYYETVGPMHPRPRRGLLTRPSLSEVLDYRRRVDEGVCELLDRGGGAEAERVSFLVTLGLHHEQQHQELLLMDVKHVLSCNPTRPAYRSDLARPSSTGETPRLEWIEFPEGLRRIGHEGPGFAYDNETPRHRTYLHPYRIASRLVTCGELLEFVEDGGYERPELWLADGWTTVEREGWSHPLYWDRDGDDWTVFTLGGERRLRPDEPACHLSLYEADAFARWAGKRLPTEAEWECAARDLVVEGNFLETGILHPAPVGPSAEEGVLHQLFGDVWEWTGSPYVAYPGFRPLAGAVGEYNGKFMINQVVLRGGSALTPVTHVRDTYRNFFYPHQRWQLGGVRLADDA